MSENVGVRFAGDVFLRRFDTDGSLQDTVIGPIAANKLAIKADAERKQRMSKGRDNYGQAVATVSVRKPTAVSLGLDAVDPKMLAVAFLGTDSVLAASGGTVTGETHNLPSGVWVKLAQANVSEVTISSKTLGTDFIVNARVGLIMALESGSIVDGASTSIAYSYGAMAGATIAGGTVSAVDFELRFDGVNLESGTDAVGLIPRLTLIPKSDIDLLGDDLAKIELDGVCIKLPDQAEHTFTTDVVYS
jgi:hypothetical protein